MAEEIRIDKGLTKTITEFAPHHYHIEVEKGATLYHYRLGKFNPKDDRNSELIVDVAENAKYVGCLVLLDDAPANLKVQINLKGKGASCDSDAIYLGSGKQKYNLALIANHEASDTVSLQKAKGIMKDASSMDFQGLINIKEGVAKISGDQLHEAILLSDTAKVKCAPELAIASEDVKCTHGSSIGMLDESALFYMESRGISKPEAKALLLKAFVLEILNKIAHEKTRDDFTAEVEKWLTKNI